MGFPHYHSCLWRGYPALWGDLKLTFFWVIDRRDPYPTSTLTFHITSTFLWVKV